MKNPRLLSRFLFISLIVAVSSASASAKDKWINLRTKNFNIISNASEGDSREAALKLEQFRYVISKVYDTSRIPAVPVTVMIFKSDDSFTPFKPLYNGKPANVAGYFQRGDDENIIAFNILGRGLKPMELIYHEYTHLLTSYTTRRWPPWLMEGMAELFSTFEVNKNNVTLGAPIDRHVYLLRESNFLPLQKLFDVSRDSPEYNERSKQGVFYAQSWALVHYLMYGDRTARQKQFIRLLKLLDTSMSVETAFKEAFQTDYSAMEKASQDYIQNSSYTVIKYTLDSTEGERDIEVRPASEAEAQSYLGTLLMRLNRLDEAEPYFKQSIALDPSLAHPYEGLGFVSLRRNKYDEAKEYLKQAAMRDSKNYLAHYYYAESIYNSAGPGSSAPRLESNREIIEKLKTSIKLMPGFAPAYSMLGFMYLATGENLAEGAELLKTGMRYAPQNKDIALNLAQIHLRLQDFDSARKAIAPLLASDDRHIKQSAQSVMKLIESYSQPLSTTTGSASGQTASASTQTSTQKPSLNIADAKTVNGVLAAIECPAGGMEVVFKTQDKLLRFSVSDPVNLQFYSQVPDLKLTIGCSVINLPAIMYFKPLSDSKSIYAGDAVAVEFTK